jgi:hypothetical protein
MEGVERKRYAIVITKQHFTQLLTKTTFSPVFTEPLYNFDGKFGKVSLQTSSIRFLP